MGVRVVLALAGATVFCAGCPSGGSNRVGGGGEPVAASEPMLLASWSEANLKVFRATAAPQPALVELGHATLNDSILRARWRGQGELVAMTFGGNVYRVTPAGAVAPVPEPDRAAWKRPAGFKDEGDADIAPEDFVDDVELAVAKGEIWKGRCTSAVMNEGTMCQQYLWIRLDPPDFEHVRTDDPMNDGLYSDWQVEPVASVKTQLVAAPATVSENEETSAPAHTLTCDDGTRKLTFPSPEQASEWTVMDVQEPRWLGHGTPLMSVPGEIPGMDIIVVDYLFAGCDGPIGGTESAITWGPKPWIATSREQVTQWDVRFDGAVIGAVPGGEVAFAPR